MRGNMAEIRLKYTRREVRENGNVRWYFVIPGKPKVRLNPKGVEEGSAAFMERYELALAGHLEGKKPKASAYIAGTFAHLVERYTMSPEFDALARNTRMSRARILKKLVAQHGDKSAQMSVKAVQGMRRDRIKTPSPANELIKTIRALYKWGVAEGLAEFNPAAGVPKVPSKTKEHRAWTPEELTMFCDHWPIGTQARLAFDLLYWTGQRIGDVARMGPHMIAGNTLRITQEKTDAVLALPIPQPLAASLRAVRPRRGHFLTRRTGASLGNAFRDWRNAAGLPADCVAHGLRKARATSLANTGATPHQIMAVTGHKTLSEVERYTRAADQEKLAREAFKGESVLLETGKPFQQSSRKSENN